MSIGNTLKYDKNVDKDKKEFTINSFAEFRECISVLMIRVKERKRTKVIFEEMSDE